jgi:hypothetical protein
MTIAKRNFGIGLLIGFLITGFFMFLMRAALADTPVALVPTQALPIQDWLGQALALGKSWKSVGVWAVLAGVVNLLVNASKTELLGNLFHKLSDNAQVLLILGLSTAAAGLTVLAKGGTLADAAVASLQSAAGAMFFQEFFNRVIRKQDASPGGMK